MSVPSSRSSAFSEALAKEGNSHSAASALSLTIFSLVHALWYVQLAKPCTRRRRSRSARLSTLLGAEMMWMATS